MGYSIKLGSKDLPIKDGFVYKDNLNETLDSGLVILDTKETLDINPFDRAIIHDNNANKIYLEVDNFMENITQFEPDEDYEYTINLMSQTKELERITCPSFSITRSRVVGGSKSVYDYIANYCVLMLPKIKVVSADGVNWEYKRKYILDEVALDRFRHIKCPEFSWNEPTLKEVLDDLMMTDDCICIVKNNVISCFDLKANGKNINKRFLVKQERSMGSSDYIDNLTITMKNSIGKDLVRACEFVSARSEGGEITTENAIIKTQHPIYNLKSVKACFTATYRFEDSSFIDRYIEVDITQFIKEKAEYEVLDSSLWKLQLPQTIEEATKYQQFTLYYQRGSNKIETMGVASTVGDSKITDILQIYIVNTNEYWELDYNNKIFRYYKLNGDIRNIGFKIEYETLDDRKMHVGKYLPMKNPDNYIFDAQTSSYVNVQQQSIFEYAKANRLGNEIITIYGEYANLSDLPQLGDKLNNNILFSREIAFYDGYIQFKGMLTKNYILKNYFTGISSKRRSWAIAKGNEALTRYEVNKYYCEFSYRSKKDKMEFAESFNNRNLVVDLISPLATDIAFSETKQINYAVFHSVAPYENLPYIAMDITAEAQGMSMCFNFGFDDNYTAGNYSYKQDKLYRNGIYPYCDKNGEFINYSIILANNIQPNFAIPNDKDVITDSTLEKKLADYSARLPKVEANEIENIQFDLNRKIFFKDNREIFKSTIQFEFCSDTEGIVATELFAKMQSLIGFKNYQRHIYISYSRGDYYNIKDTKARGGEAGSSYGIAITQLNRTSVEFHLTNNGSEVRGITSWGIADENGNLIIGFNNPSLIRGSFYIYLNILLNRDYNIYDSVENQNIVGNMVDGITNE